MSEIRGNFSISFPGSLAEGLKAALVIWPLGNGIKRQSLLISLKGDGLAGPRHLETYNTHRGRIGQLSQGVLGCTDTVERFD